MEYKNNKNTAEPSFLGFIAFFLIFISSFITLLSAKNKNTILPQITKTFFPSSTETQNWKTYTNSTYKYSFKYPSDWLINETISSNNNLCLSTNKQYPSDIGPICSLSLTTYYESGLFDNKKSNLDNWINLQVSDGVFYKKETINMFSKPAYKISLMEESETKSIFFEKDNNIFEITNNFKEISKTEQQIIDSLKFDY